jgi:Ser/Thr protein kinase RdoA (MazF antagonist)
MENFANMFQDLPPTIRTYAQTHGFADDIHDIAQRIEAVTLTVPNRQSVYRFVAHHGTYAQKLAHELANTAFVRQHGIATPQLQHRETIDGYDVLRFAYIDGNVVGSKATAMHAERLATQLRMLHDRCAHIVPASSNVVDALVFCQPIFDPAYAHEFTADQRALAAEEVNRFRAITSQHDEVTLIHTDCHFSNMVFHDDTVTLIDWAECGRGSRFYDVGVAMHAITYHKERSRDNMRAFIASYFGRSTLTDHEHAMIDAYMRQRFLEGMIWHLDDPPEVQQAEYDENRQWIADCLQQATTFTLHSWLDTSV